MARSENIPSATGPLRHAGAGPLPRFAVVGFSVAAIAVFAFGNHVLGFSNWTTHWWSDGFWTLAALGAALKCIATASRISGPSARAWRFFGAACIAWFVGMLAWDYFELVEGVVTPFPAISDLGFLAFAPLYLAGLFVYSPKNRIAGLRAKAVTNLGLVSTAVAMAAVVILYRPVLTSQESGLYLTTALAYPVVYLSILCFGLGELWMNPWGRELRIYLLLLAGVAVHALVDTAYAASLLQRTYETGAYLDSFWLIGFAFIAWAAAEEEIRPAPVEPAADPEIYVRRSETLKMFLAPICGVVLLVLLALFRHDVDSMILAPMTPLAIIFFIFLGAQEWWSRQVETRLKEQISLEQTKLKESREDYKSILDNMADTFYRTDKDGRIVLMSPSVTALLGYSIEEIVGNRLADFYVDPASRDRFLKKLEDDGGRTLGYEALLRHKDGHSVWVSSSTRYIRGPDGEILGVEGTSRDVTAKRENEEQLRKLSMIDEQSPTIVVITDVEGNIEYVNPKFTAITGYSSEEAIGKTPAILKSGTTPSRTYKALWDALSSGREWRGEILNRKKSGELYWSHESISPIHDGSGEITHFLAMEEDVTEQRRIQEQLRESQKMESIGQLAGGVAHEFNNLLMTVLGNIELLQDKLADDDPERGFANAIESAARRGGDLTRRLLAYSRPESENPEIVDVNEKLRSVAGMLRPSLGETVELEINQIPDVTLAKLDAGRLQDTIINLAINARDAMPNGGKLTIETANVTLSEAERNRVLQTDTGKYIRLTVSDTGEGIPTQILSRVFEPFFTTKDVGKGTGLGLSMVHGFAKQSGGFVEIDSKVGKGTRVSLYLPRAAGSSAQPHHATASQLPTGFGTVLVVEDDEAVRTVATEILKSLGYEVIEATDGAGALKILETGRDIDLLFTDIVMPGGTTGVQLAELVHHRHPDLKVLFTTGYSDATVLETDRWENDAFVLNKPYTRQELAEAVHDLMS